MKESEGRKRRGEEGRGGERREEKRFICDGEYCKSLDTYR